MNTNKPLELCGLWKQTDKHGNPYLSGTLGGVRIMVFANQYKTKENQPDYRIVMAQNERKDQREAAASASVGFGDEDSAL